MSNAYIRNDYVQWVRQQATDSQILGVRAELDRLAVRIVQLETVADAAQAVVDIELPSADNRGSFVTYALKLGKPRQALVDTLATLNRKKEDA